MNQNKINLLTLIHVDNFIFKKSMNYLNRNTEIIKIKNIENILNNFKNKIENLYFFTYYPDLFKILNKVMELNNIKKKCLLVDSISDMINSTKDNILLIGNEDYYDYTKIKNNNCLIINSNKYNISYKDNDPLLEVLNNISNIFSNNKNNVLDILEKEKIYERYEMLKEDKYFFKEKDNCI